MVSFNCHILTQMSNDSLQKCKSSSSLNLPIDLLDAQTYEGLALPPFPTLSAPHSLLFNSASDPTSDAYSQLESESQTPGGSTTSVRQQRSRATDNPRGQKPTSLSYYRSTEVHAPLAQAKEYFSATSFGSGYFFYHRRSPYADIFQTYARDAIAQAANACNSK